jgi:hypothetical protein
MLHAVPSPPAERRRPAPFFRIVTGGRREYTMRDFGEIVESSARLNGGGVTMVSFIETANVGRR